MFETQEEVYQSVPLKCSVAINALAYSIMVPMTRKDVFMALRPVANVIKLFTAVNSTFHNRLECLYLASLSSLV